MEKSMTPKIKAAKNKIFEAAMKLMQYSEYDLLTVRNICKAADISTGTFYHYFKSKEDLTTYVITKGYEKYRQDSLNNILSPQYRVVDILTYFADYFSGLGLGFMSNFLSVKNQSLNVDCIIKSEVHKQIVEDLVGYIRYAKELGMIGKDYDVKKIYDELNVIFYGAVFYWCLSQGNYDLIKSIKIILTVQFNKYLIPEFLME